MAKPRISFTFPIRWLKDSEDRKFLYKNLQRLASGSHNKNVMNEALQSAMANTQPFLTPAYMVILKTHAYKPVPYKFTEKDAQKAFEKVIPGARCMNLEKFFVQTKSRELLPVMELEIYY